MTRRSGTYGRARKALARKADQSRPEPGDGLNLSPIAARALHSIYLDSLFMEAPTIARAMLAHDALTFVSFVGAFHAGVLRLQSTVGDDGEPAVGLELWDGQHYSLLVIVRGELLGLDPEVLGRAWSTRLDDELRGITE